MNGFTSYSVTEVPVTPMSLPPGVVWQRNVGVYTNHRLRWNLTWDPASEAHMHEVLAKWDQTRRSGPIQWTPPKATVPVYVLFVGAPDIARNTMSLTLEEVRF